MAKDATWANSLGIGLSSKPTQKLAQRGTVSICDGAKFKPKFHVKLRNWSKYGGMVQLFLMREF